MLYGEDEELLEDMLCHLDLGCSDFKPIPKRVFSHGEHDTALSQLLEWQDLNAELFELQLSNNEDLRTWAGRRFASSSIPELFDALPSPAHQDDLSRFLALLATGGLFTSPTSHPLQPIADWSRNAVDITDRVLAPSYNPLSPPSLIVGVEWTGYTVKNPLNPLFSRSAGLAFETFGATPGHPVLVDAVRSIWRSARMIEAGKEGDGKGEQSVRADDRGVLHFDPLAGDAEREWTGAGVLTDAVARCVFRTAPHHLALTPSRADTSAPAGLPPSPSSHARPSRSASATSSSSLWARSMLAAHASPSCSTGRSEGTFRRCRWRRISLRWRGEGSLESLGRDVDSVVSAVEACKAQLPSYATSWPSQVCVDGVPPPHTATPCASAPSATADIPSETSEASPAQPTQLRTVPRVIALASSSPALLPHSPHLLCTMDDPDRALTSLHSCLTTPIALASLPALSSTQLALVSLRSDLPILVRQRAYHAFMVRKTAYHAHSGPRTLDRACFRLPSSERTELTFLLRLTAILEVNLDFDLPPSLADLETDKLLVLQFSPVCESPEMADQAGELVRERIRGAVKRGALRVSRACVRWDGGERVEVELVMRVEEGGMRLLRAGKEDEGYFLEAGRMREVVCAYSRVLASYLC